MARRLVVGVDSSTQACKVVARDLESGAVVATGTAPHPATTPPRSEQRPQAWWDALGTAFGQLGGARADVVAIAVAGQQHGLVLVDDAGRSLRPAILWNDTTAAPDAAALVEAFGASNWVEAAGSVPVASFTIAKLARLAAREPDLLARAAMVMLPHDYLTWRLSCRHVTDRGDASGTGWFDPVGGRYRADLLDLAVGPGRGEEWLARLPTVLAPTDAVGPIGAAAAAALDVPGDVVVGAGTGDNMAAALGLGLRPADVAISLGTSGTVFAVSATPARDPTGAVAGFASASGEYLPLVCTLNATKVTGAMARWLGTNAPGLIELALSATDDPGDVVLVPYLDGERTPNLPDAKGTIDGVTTATTRAQLALAAHDGVLCGLLDGLDALGRVGASLGGRHFLVGGGARSAAYRQRCADLSGAPVVVPDTDEVVAAGAALQAAAVATGADLAAVAEAWRLGTGTTVEPTSDATQRRRHYALVRARLHGPPPVG